MNFSIPEEMLTYSTDLFVQNWNKLTIVDVMDLPNRIGEEMLLFRKHFLQHYKPPESQ